MFAAPALGQEDAVVVTATRTAQPALEVPASVDRIYGDEIREGKAQVNLSESLGRVPGISVQNRQNYAQDLQIQSRGFGARSTFGVRGIRLIADGIPATMPDGQGQASTFSLGSAERIEVLRGPFSALYGNATGGVIAVDTQDGPAQPTVEGDFLAGSYQTKRGALRIGGQYGDVNATGEASLFQTNGYRDHSWTRRDQANAKLKVQLEQETTLTMAANYLHQPDTQDPLGLTKAEKDANPRQATPNALLFNTKKTVLQDQVGGTLVQKLGAHRVEVMAYGGNRSIEQFLAIPVATQNQATHSGAIVDLDRNYGGTALRYFGKLGDWRLAAGFEHDLMNEARKGYINNNGVGGALKRDEQNKVDSTDFYGQAEWKFAPRWALHGGVRRSAVRFSSEDHFIAAGNPNDSGAKTYHATTPVAGLLFRASETTSLYANYGRGFETPTFLEIAYTNTGSGLNFDLEASRSRHAELGIKHVAPGVRYSAAVFGVVTENEIVVDQNTGGRATFKNVGHTRRTGFELGADKALGGGFDARVAWTYLKAVFEEGFNTVITTTNAVVAVPAGATLPGTAKNQLYGEFRYKREAWFAKVEGLYRTRVATNDPNDEFADAFGVVNLAAGLTQRAAGWRVTEFARVDNVGNRNYVGSVIVNETNRRYYEPSPRRNMTVGVQAALQF
ncbi:MAG: iron complex outerrane recepter protein [Betaproteobacteria bacterium]|nr:iron complex outerrane recepter protein [Betaproteobacteria bacterium]